MESADQGAADGTIGIDHVWKRKLERLLRDTPLPATLSESVQTLPGVDMDDLQAVIEGKREEWEELVHGAFGLPLSYSIDFAVAIYVYTLENPCVYRVVNRAMFNPLRRLPGAISISDELEACSSRLQLGAAGCLSSLGRLKDGLGRFEVDELLATPLGEAAIKLAIRHRCKHLLSQPPVQAR